MTASTLADHAARLGIAEHRITAEPAPACELCGTEGVPLQPVTLQDAFGPWADDFHLCGACAESVQL